MGDTAVAGHVPQYRVTGSGQLVHDPGSSQIPTNANPSAELGPRQRPRHEVVLGVGPSGTGKCHICAAPGLAACGQGRRVPFVTVVDLVTELSEAQAEHGLSRLRQQLDRLDLLILDLPTPQLCRQGARTNREWVSSRLLLVIGPARVSAQLQGLQEGKDGGRRPVAARFDGSWCSQGQRALLDGEVRWR